MEWFLPLTPVPPTAVNPSPQAPKDAHLITDPVWQRVEGDKASPGSALPRIPIPRGGGGGRSQQRPSLGQCSPEPSSLGLFVLQGLPSPGTAQQDIN